MHVLIVICRKMFLTLNLIGLCPENANIFGKNSGQKNFFAAGHHRLSQGNSSRHPPN